MTQLVSFFPPEMIHALGWAVVHSLWQGFAVALLLAAVWPLLQRRDARLRYLLANLSLSLVLVSAVGTFLILFYGGASEAVQDAGALVSPVVVEVESEGLGGWLAVWLERQLPAVVLVWLLGSGFFLLRLLGGYAYIQFLRHRHVWEPSPELQRLFQGLKKRLGLRRPVRLLESALVRVPMVIGHLRPVILLPVGLMSGLSPKQVEAVLAHELGHILRNDYLWNLIQSLAETLLYFNPAVWWISGLIRSERENCCDDIAVRVCGDSMVYAKALVNLQEIHRSAPSLAMALSLRPRQHLLARVERLLKQAPVKPQPAEKALITLLALAFIGVLSFGAVPDERPETSLEWNEHHELEWTHGGTSESVEHSTRFPFYAPLQQDTVPPAQKEKEKHKDKSKKGKSYKDIEITLVDGEIRRLLLDGEEIPPERFHVFEYLMADEIRLNSVPPVPPVPSVEPAAPVAPAPPVPPLPPAKAVEPVPPAPPAPPAYEREIRIKKKGKKKKTTIIERGTPPREQGYSFRFEDEPLLAESLALKLQSQEEALRRSEKALRAREQALRQRLRREGNQCRMLEERERTRAQLEAHKEAIRREAERLRSLRARLQEEQERTRAQLEAQREALRREAERLRSLREKELEHIRRELQRERQPLQPDTNSTGFHFEWDGDAFTLNEQALPEVFSIHPQGGDVLAEFFSGGDAEPFDFQVLTDNHWSYLFSPGLEGGREPASDSGYLQGLLEQFRERLQDGNLSREWLEEWNREWEQDFHGGGLTPKFPQ